jgi:hypothetical protein
LTSQKQSKPLQKRRISDLLCKTENLKKCSLWIKKFFFGLSTGSVPCLEMLWIASPEIRHRPMAACGYLSGVSDEISISSGIPERYPQTGSRQNASRRSCGHLP